jgi:hypothetical protein
VSLLECRHAGDDLAAYLHGVTVCTQSVHCIQLFCVRVSATTAAAADLADGCAAAAAAAGVTLIDDYFSAWECRTILSPWADPTVDAVTEPQPACAIIL